MDEHAALISGSPSPRSRSRALLERASAQLEAAGFVTTTIDLAALPADALLGRRADEGLTAALALVQTARIVVAGSPVYRATYSGLLKVFFDLLSPDALRGVIGVPIMTGGSPAHQLAVDHGLRPLFASLGAVTVAAGVYGHDSQFDTTPALRLRPAGAPASAAVGAIAAVVSNELLDSLEHAVEEAIVLARAPSPALRP